MSSAICKTCKSPELLARLELPLVNFSSPTTVVEHGSISFSCRWSKSDTTASLKPWIDSNVSATVRTSKVVTPTLHHLWELHGALPGNSEGFAWFFRNMSEDVIQII